MKSKELIERLCSLCTNVASRRFKNEFIADCFCGQGPLPFAGLDEKILIFIEEAVEQKMKEEPQMDEESVKKRIESQFSGLSNYFNRRKRTER